MRLVENRPSIPPIVLGCELEANNEWTILPNFSIIGQCMPELLRLIRSAHFSTLPPPYARHFFSDFSGLNYIKFVKDIRRSMLLIGLFF